MARRRFTALIIEAPMQKILATLCCTWVASCGEKEVDLGRGYKYVRVDGSNAAIADRDNHMMVDPNVKRYKVVGSYVVGEREDAKIDERLSRNFGYFIFEMRSGQLLEGLDKAKFEKALTARNLNAEPF